MKTIVCGDIHMDFGALNHMRNKQRPNILLACGDFGYWPRMPATKFYGPTAAKHPKLPMPKTGKNCKMYWCDGNHEDHQSLIDRTTDELWPNVFYMPRGSSMLLPDGRRVLFMGGADSHDKGYRTMGVDWFKEELITQADLDRIQDHKYDIVISHTCPCEWVPGVYDHSASIREADPSRHALSIVLQKYRPKLWYFGHWHRNVTCYDKEYDCRWTALDHTGGMGRWWEVLRE